MRIDSTYQQSAGDQDENATILASRLGIQGSDLVYDLLEGKVLEMLSSVRGTTGTEQASAAYRQLLHDATGALDRVRLESEHRLVALRASVSGYFPMILYRCDRRRT